MSYHQLTIAMRGPITMSCSRGVTTKGTCNPSLLKANREKNNKNTPQLQVTVGTVFERDHNQAYADLRFVRSQWGTIVCQHTNQISPEHSRGIIWKASPL